MKKHKHFLFCAVLLLCGALLLGAAGCGKAETPEDSSIPVVDATVSSSVDCTTTTETTTTTTTTTGATTTTTTIGPTGTTGKGTTGTTSAYVGDGIGVPPRSSRFKSVKEMLDWIQNDDFADCTFKQTVRQLKLEQLLVIESIDDAFWLEDIEVRHTGTRINYLFVSEADERIHLNVDLPPMNLDANYLEAFIVDSNREQQKRYEKCPELLVGPEAVILGKSRKTYTRDYGQTIVRETGKTTPIYALCFLDIDGYKLQGSLRGSLACNNWDNKYLDHFRFSMQTIE